MRVETKTVTYYTLAELKEHHPNGFERALDTVRTSMWNDMAWTEDVGQTIAYEFGSRVGDPTVERFGEGDYSGVYGVELSSWEVQARNAHVGFAGTLEPEHSTSLPWHDWIESVTLKAHRSSTEIVVVDSEEAPYIGYTLKRHDYDEEQERLHNLREEIRDAVWEALNEALAAGEKQAEYLESEEHLLELAEGNEWEFDEHGAWA